jgi:DNA polymerase alpha subunit A
LFINISKLNKLATYKRARKGGTRVFKEGFFFSPEYTLTTRRWQEEDDTIYDEVTEDQYKSIVKGRLQRYTPTPDAI